MTSEERWRFLKLYAPGISISLVAYAGIMTIRSFRDYFALQLYTEANQGKAVPASTYFWADFPGSLTVCLSLGLLSKVHSNRTAVFVMCMSMISGVLILGGGTLLYLQNVISGIAWQVTCGVGIYTAYLVMGTAFLDRLLAASGSEGTIVFLQFISDGSGWLGTVFILFWKNLSADKNMSVSALFAQICLWSSAIMAILLFLMFVYFACVLPKSQARAGSAPEVLRLNGSSKDNRRTASPEEDMALLDAGGEQALHLC